MNAAGLLVALYPPAVRERWGADIRHDLADAGMRAWPDTVRGAARLWLHPSEWPEPAPGETRRVVTVALFTVLAVVALLVRTGQPASGPWLLAVVAGLIMATPLPRPGAVRAAARILAAPVLAALALLVAGNSGLAGHAAGIARLVVTSSYWVILVFIAYRLCAVVARAGTPPGRNRLRAALLLAGSGTAVGAMQTWPAPSAALLALLAGTTLYALRDLSEASTYLT
jgi:hypothetical protein